ncbi:MAG: Abi family protein [Pseudoclavibacter sp.]|nr:Abi family protein [Pseudoclavibacter sp.]
MARPAKSFTTIEQQIAILQRRGMLLEADHAAIWLRSIGYYRLSGYWYPYRKIREGPERRGDEFVPETKLEYATRLYEFDRKMRTLVHDGLERVEVALRSELGYLLGSKDPMSYEDKEVFRPNFNHEEWLQGVKKKIDRARDRSAPIKHHLKNYTGIPVWVLIDHIDFSDASKLFAGLRSEDQRQVSERMSVSIDSALLTPSLRERVKRNNPLADWLRQLTVLRNSCAHHARIWNRSFAPASTNAIRTIRELQSLPVGQSEQLYGALLLIGYLLQGISPGTTWTSKVRELVATAYAPIPGRTTQEMGFPETWRNEALWRE